MALTRANLLYLFDNYNNISQTIVEEFVDYIFTLVPITGGIIYDSNGKKDIDIDNRILYDSAEKKSEDWQNRFLYDSAEKKSMDYNIRKLYGANGTTVVFEWTSLGLNARVDLIFQTSGSVIRDSNGDTVLDPINRIVYDNAGNICGDFINRQLSDSGAVVKVDWENGRLNTGLNNTLDWINGNLVDGTVNTVSWIGGLGFFNQPPAARQTVSNAPMVLLADVIAVVNDIRAAIGNGAGKYGLVELI